MGALASVPRLRGTSQHASLVIGRAGARAADQAIWVSGPFHAHALAAEAKPALHRPCPFCLFRRAMASAAAVTDRPSIRLSDAIDLRPAPTRRACHSLLTRKWLPALGTESCNSRQTDGSLVVATVYPAIFTIVLITPRLGASAAIIS